MIAARQNEREAAAEIIAWLERLIGFDTTAGGGDAEACVYFLRRELSERGVNVQTFTTMGGVRTAHHLMAEVPGEGPEAVVLHAHLDTADFGAPEDWLFPADRATHRHGCVCGRGAIDCKGPLAVWMKLLSDAARGRPRAYSLRLLVSDLEETGGADGLGLLLDRHPEILSGVRLVIGEGGGFPFPFRNELLYTFQTQERETDVSAAAEAPDPAEIERILSLGIEMGYYTDDLLVYAAQAASLTGRRLDIRPLYDGMESFFREAPVCGVFERFGRLFEAALRAEVPGARLMPCITPGNSDNRWFRKAGVPTAGFFPLDSKNSLGGIHGSNEYISEASLGLAWRVVSRILDGIDTVL